MEKSDDIKAAARRNRSGRRLKKWSGRRVKAIESIAARADNWEDREGKARPTPERLSKGRFTLQDTDDAGVTVAVDGAVTELDRLLAAGVINADQCQGGHDFAALMYRTRLVSHGRSCLNFEPVGYEDGTPSHQEIVDSRDRTELYLACGSFTWAELRRVACEDRKMTDAVRLKDGLTLCAKFWRRK